MPENLKLTIIVILTAKIYLQNEIQNLSFIRIYFYKVNYIYFCKTSLQYVLNDTATLSLKQLFFQLKIQNFL